MSERNQKVENMLTEELMPAPTFAIRNLSVLACANGFTLWHYRATASTLRQVRESGYFDAAADMLAFGDMVMVTAQDGAALHSVASAVVPVRVAGVS